ncbi:hypothetical protein [Glycomyces paridis]|uniref:hypothetical protein n=1 Tax=Glycomyces paridis TaxID=2126555 RepID=UPI00130513BC|nr:hypothetical protein [Glycomyces paridis]
MKRTLFKTLAATGSAALLLSGCGMLGGDDTSGEANGGDDGGGNAVYDEIASWNACEVLGNLQPITEFMGIQGYGSSTSAGGDPGNSEIGNTLDPAAVGCNGLIYLDVLDGIPMNGEIQVKIIPTESEEQAATVYEERVSAAESESAKWDEAESEEFGDPWDQGTIVSWTGDTSQPNVQVIARDGQWVFHIDLYHTQDYGLRGGSEPALAFTDEDLNQWFVDTYLPEVNQTVNDRIAEVA